MCLARTSGASASSTTPWCTSRFESACQSLLEGARDQTLVEPLDEAVIPVGHVTQLARSQREVPVERARATRHTVEDMRYTTLGNSGTIVSTQCLGTMTFGAEADEETSAPSSTPSRRPAAPSSTRRTSTARASPRRSPAGGSSPTPRTPPGWSWRPRAASRWARGTTTSACRAAICARRSTHRSPGSASSTSTSTRCTRGTP